MKTNQKVIIKSALLYVTVAVISFVIGLLMFKVREIYPFGEKNVLCMDLWGQYFPMYVNNKEADSLSDLMYSWNGAFGFNNWAQSAYYCNSIFLLLFKFIPVRNLSKALGIFCLLKMSFSGVSCLAYLRYKTKDGSELFQIASAVAYSVCAYMHAYISQFMWTDIVIYAPLIMLGIEKLINEKKMISYTVILAVALISNFYIGYAVCIFCVIYFVGQTAVKLGFYIANKRPHCRNKKMVIGCILRFGVSSLIAGAMSAFVIIPVAMAISQTIASENPFPEKFEWYGSLISVLQNITPERPLFQEYTGVNAFTGTVIFISVPLYFVNRSFPLKERISDFIATIILLISLDCNYLNYIWHGFHFPNQLPARWSFLLSLFLIMLSCKGLTGIKNIPVSHTVAGCFAGLAIFYATVGGIGEKTEDIQISNKASAFILILAFGIILVSLVMHIKREVIFDKKIKITKNAVVILTTAVVSFMIVFDSGKNFVTVSQYEGVNGTMVSDETSYSKAVIKSCTYGQQWKCGEDDFYRVEANNGHTFNNSMFGDYHGMRYYSSTMNGNVFKFLRFMGNRVYADKVSSVYSLSSPVQNSIFGIKYFMDFDRYLNNVVPDMTLVEETPEGNFYENPTCLPIAYAVSDNILDFEVNDQIRALTNQNVFINAMYGDNIEPFKEIPVDMTTENITLMESEDWNVNYFSNGSGEPSLFHYTFKVEEDGDYFMEQNFRAGTIHVTGNNIDKNVDPGANRMVFIGKLAKDTEITIDVKIENIGLGCFGLNVYKFDNQAWETAYNKFASQSLDVTSFKNTTIKGEITMQEDGVMFTSIAQDGGWRVYCDGNEVSTYKIADALLGADIPAGQHTITFKYHVPGFVTGLIISLSALAVLILIIVLRRPLKKTLFAW
ncbi:MAG: YfhO family protein [Ruminococcus sp.]|nr:YfhO family protein [Ruminococcus sp.]